MWVDPNSRKGKNYENWKHRKELIAAIIVIFVVIWLALWGFSELVAG